MKHFHAHGKLLLSAEYMVLYGSTALALPLKPGQSLEITQKQEPGVFIWTAFYKDKLWFMATFEPSSLEILSTSNMEYALRLKDIIRACIEMKPSFSKALYQKKVITQLDFSPDYGFGSSSTLIALLAAWAEVNPMDLHFRVSEGSGYDVACAISEGPITYELIDHAPHYKHIPFNPPFRKQLWFAWLGNKLATSPHLKEIAGRLKPDLTTIRLFSELTEKMIEDRSLGQFRETMERHEHELSIHLGIDKVSGKFPDLPGSIKSLGAWGGDFVMIATEADPQTLRDYLAKKEIHTLYNFNELVYEG